MEGTKRRATKERSTTAGGGGGGCKTFSDLPNDLIWDIMSRLSVNSIFICKQVCKTWHNIFIDILREPYFAKLHLPRSPLSLILYRRSGRKRPCWFGILELGNHAGLRRRKLTMKFESDIQIPRSYIEMVGSCNGTICLADHFGKGTVIVCTPIRTQYSILPTPPKPALQSLHRSWGFGYSPSTEQFKVVRFVDTNRASRFGWDVIFTRGNDDAWRSIGGTGQPSPVNLRSFNFRFVYLNGALHWLGKADDSRFTISYFVIENEQLGNFPLPPHIGDPSLRLGVLDDCLFICEDHSCPSVVNVWVMKDYGHAGSLILEWVFQEPFPYGVAGELKPVKTLKDGVVLIIFDNTTLASYNPVTGVLEKIKYHRAPVWNESVADVPSFLYPLDAMRGTCSHFKSRTLELQHDW